MNKEISEKIIQEISTLLETISDFCSYHRMSEDIIFMEEATEVFKKHTNLSEEEIMKIRLALFIGYDAGMRRTKNEEDYSRQPARP